ncbi:MAG TPA: SRPBCC domain-containing protein [Mycobacteriales bacterium]|nr:SRPBCC domain-containing protein [Mycobacteriales bacterium]
MRRSMEVVMSKEFEVHWDGVLPATPEQVWDAVTVHPGGWLWPVSYEPRLGGAERGLSGNPGTVTGWEPPRHFQTRAEHGAWQNQIDCTLEPSGGGTRLRYRHTGVFERDYDIQYDQCVQHTGFYLHTLGEYVAHFAGRDTAYCTVDAPGSFAALCRRLGLPAGAAVGDPVRFGVPGLPAFDGTVDYLTPAFLGVRTDAAMLRVFGRDAWGGRVGVALHQFGPGVDPELARRCLSDWLAGAEAVA